MSFEHTDLDGVGTDWCGTPIFDGDRVVGVFADGTGTGTGIGTVIDGVLDVGVRVIWDDDQTETLCQGFRLAVVYDV